MLEKGGKFDSIEITNFQHPQFYAPELQKTNCDNEHKVKLEKIFHECFPVPFQETFPLPNTLPR